MNFLSFQLFLEFLIKETLFTPTSTLTTATDRWGQWPRQMPRWTDQVKMLTGPSDDVMHHRSSQVAHELADLDRIRRNGLVHRLQKNQASRTVPAPLDFSHRNVADGMSEQRCLTAIDAEMLQNELGAMECIGRIRSSPRSCRARRRGRRWSGGGDRWQPSFGMPSSSRTVRGLPACVA
jgi:hypothetical protein